MAGKQITGDSLSSNLAGLSKNQLYDIMCQMKSLIEQNHQQARKILIENPSLTKALFQAQIMLGMVQAPQAVQPQVSPQPAPPVQQKNIITTPSTPMQISLPDQANVSQGQVLLRKQQQNQPSLPTAPIPPGQDIHPQTLPLQPTEHKRGPLNSQANQMPHQQSSQVPNMPPLSIHSAPQLPPAHQPPMPSGPGHLQHSMQTTAVSHHLLQPPIPPQPRPPIPMQYQPQIGANMNFQNSGISQMHHSQPMFHTTSRPLPGGMGPFHQGQPPHPHQLPHQPLYQAGGSHMSGEFNNQGGGNMQGERASPWSSVSRENTAGGQLPAPPSLNRAHLPVGSQPPRPPPLTPEVEQQLLQQVMSLTPEQINLLPPEQRHQVLQLQQMLRQ